MCRGGEVDWQTVKKDFGDFRGAVSFSLGQPQGPDIACHVVAARTLGAPSHIREIEINADRFVLEGAKDADGVYCTRIQTPWGPVLEPDMMRLLIREFLRGDPAADGRAGRRNLDRVLRILGRLP